MIWLWIALGVIYVTGAAWVVFAMGYENNRSIYRWRWWEFVLIASTWPVFVLWVAIESTLKRRRQS